MPSISIMFLEDIAIHGEPMQHGPKCNTMLLPTGTYSNGSKAQDLEPGISEFINKS